MLLVYCLSSANGGAILLLSCGNIVYWLCAWAHWFPLWLYVAIPSSFLVQICYVLSMDWNVHTLWNSSILNFVFLLYSKNLSQSHVIVPVHLQNIIFLWPIIESLISPNICLAFLDVCSAEITRRWTTITTTISPNSISTIYTGLDITGYFLPSLGLCRHLRW